VNQNVVIEANIAFTFSRRQVPLACLWAPMQTTRLNHHNKECHSWRVKNWSHRIK